MKLLNVKTLRKASYEGIQFEIESASLTFGRRTVTHQFPQRDLPYVEDLGRVTRQFSISGFIIGDDFIERSRRLIEKIEAQVGTDRRANHGKLVHPWLGTLDVTPIDSPNITYDRAKRICSFTLSFLETGTATTAKSVSWSNVLLSKADELYSKVFGDWDPNKVAGIIDDVTSEINNCATALSECKFAQLFNLGSDILDMAHDIVNSLYYKTEQAKNNLLGALSLSQYSSSITDWKVASEACTESITLPDLKPTVTSTSQDSNKVLSEQRLIDTAADEIKQNMRMVLIANAMGAVTMIGEDNDINADGSSRSVSDDRILSIRNNLLQAIDAEMFLQGSDAGQNYINLVDSYTAVYNYLTSKLNGDNGTETVTLNQSESAFALAYDKYEDATRADEIVDRNNVINPLFMPVGDFTLSRT